MERDSDITSGDRAGGLGTPLVSLLKGFTTSVLVDFVSSAAFSGVTAIDSINIDLVSAAIVSVVAGVVQTAIGSVTLTIMHSGVAD